MLEIPIVASNIREGAKIIDEYSCGIIVNQSPKDFADAINLLFSKNDLARKMGINGRKAVLNELNWDNEFAKLLKLYNILLKNE